MIKRQWNINGLNAIINMITMHFISGLYFITGSVAKYVRHAYVQRCYNFFHAQ